MNDLLMILQLPFMQRALIGGVIVAAFASWMGILAVLKRSSLVGDVIAHSSLAGVAIGLLAGIDPIVAAALFAIAISIGLPFLEKSSNIPFDSLLGFTLPVSMGLGVILLSYIPGYQPELISFLFGSILSISWNDILLLGIIVLLISAIMYIFKDKLVFVAFDEEYAYVSGIKVQKINVIYSVLLAITIVISIQLVGIILVNALLVIPASTVRLFSRSLRSMFFFTPIISIITTILGILFSYGFNIPSGPAIAVTAGATFFATFLLKKAF